MRVHVYFLTFVIFLCPLCSGGYAAQLVDPKQTSFSVKEEGSQYRYEFGWRDSLGRSNSLLFSLHQSDVKKGFSEFQPVEAAYAAAKLRTSKIDFTSLENKYGVKIHPAKEGFKIVSFGQPSNVEAISAEINKAVQREENNILKRRFYTAQDSNLGKFISVDFAAVINRYRNISRIIVTDAGPNIPNDKRGAAQYWLDFIQSIPYSTEFTNKAGFQTPIGMFTENKGDCDTKAVAYASLLQQCGIRSILIHIPEHMFMGVEIPSEPSDICADYKGRRYVLCEPAGSGFRLGEVPEESLQGIKAKQNILGPF
jgi:hypothetical protein